jgi:uncharacterized protein
MDKYSIANDLYAAGDYPAALAAYEELALTGNPYCLVVAARMYAEGQGTRKDLTKARSYLISAVQLGNVEGYLQLAFVEKESGDDVAFFIALKRAAEAGSLPAQYQLGRCMLRGVGTPIDTDRGWAVIEQASENGHLGARIALSKKLLRRPWDVANFLRGAWVYASTALAAFRLILKNPDDDRVR